MYPTFATCPGLLVALFITAITFEAQQVCAGTKTLDKEHLRLDNLSRLHHDQQMARWAPSLMADGVKSWPCPDASLIAPCGCATSGSPLYNFDIDCSAVKSDDDIIRAFQTLFPFDDIERLLIDGLDADNKVPITNFTQIMFNTKSFSLITIRDTTLESIEDNVFQLSHNTLTSLSLERNKLQLFPFQIISEYIKLTFIHMPSNDILELPKLNSQSLLDINLNGNHHLVLLDEEETFVYTPALRTVRLVSTNITRIPPNLFSHLQHIDTIFISSNVIRELEANAINPPQPTIKMLGLASNSLETVRVGAITGMASSGEIDLSDNAITTLDQDVWEAILQQLDNDEALILDGNLLQCGCDMYWILIEPEHKRKLSPESKCHTGDLVTALNLEFLHANCK